MDDIDLTEDRILTDEIYLPWEIKKPRPSLAFLVDSNGFLKSTTMPWSVREREPDCLIRSSEYEIYDDRCICCGRVKYPYNFDFCDECTFLGRMDPETQWIRQSRILAFR